MTKPRLLIDNIRKHWPLYLFVLPAVLVSFTFDYLPLYGLQIAFKNYNFADGIGGSPWAARNGLQHFYRFITSMDFWPIIRNTVGISIYTLALGFPLPIFMALMFNQIKQKRVKKWVQTVTYMPHFISIVVLVGMVMLFLSPSSGMYGHLVRAFGGEARNLMGEPKWFSTIYVLSHLWQNTGWNSIIYLAALAGVDTNLYEAAKIDGASRLRLIWHVDLPHLRPTMIMLLILSSGRIMQVGFDKVYLMQNLLNHPASEVISTYVYSMGILNRNFSYSTAIGLFNTLINFVLLVMVNKISKRVSDNSLW
jgi:putative aldouronate transport system permease protein